ncbi:beta strand repeat-containing protein [Cysteiniphilum halobium]|uniref:beta strand repeat-containing protein n=1 Tax=Cysteiniphilum halobium TaxID=2219059 RepID=UPI003F857AD3
MSTQITEKDLQDPSSQKIILLKTFQDNHLPIDFAQAKFALDGQDILIESHNGEVYHLVFGGQLANLDKKAFELDFNDGKTLTAQQVLDIASADIINTDGHLTHKQSQQDITPNVDAQTKVYVINEAESAEDSINEDGSNLQLQSDVNESTDKLLNASQSDDNNITATDVPVVEAQSQNNSHNEIARSNNPTVPPKLTVSPDLSMYIPKPQYDDANHTVKAGGSGEALGQKGQLKPVILDLSKAHHGWTIDANQVGASKQETNLQKIFELPPGSEITNIKGSGTSNITIITGDMQPNLSKNQFAIDYDTSDTSAYKIITIHFSPADKQGRTEYVIKLDVTDNPYQTTDGDGTFMLGTHPNAQEITGSQFDDIILASDRGNDSYDGNAGNDTVDYSNHLNGVTITGSDDGGNSFSGTFNNGIEKIEQTLKNIEVIRGSSASDTFISSTTTQATFEAGKGDDHFISHGGEVVFDGGQGSDTVDYSDLSAKNTGINFDLKHIDFVSTNPVDSTEAVDGIVVDLTNGDIVHSGNKQDHVENVEQYIGTNHNDQFITSASDDNINTGKGIDEVVGSQGNDHISFGGSGKINYSGLNGVTNISVDGNKMSIDKRSASNTSLGSDTVNGAINEVVIGELGGEVHVNNNGNLTVIGGGNASHNTFYADGAHTAFIGGGNGNHSNTINIYNIGQNKSANAYIEGHGKSNTVNYYSGVVNFKGDADSINDTINIAFEQGANNDIDLKLYAQTSEVNIGTAKSGVNGSIAVESYQGVTTVHNSFYAGMQPVNYIVHGGQLIIDYSDSSVSHDVATLDVNLKSGVIDSDQGALGILQSGQLTEIKGLNTGNTTFTQGNYGFSAVAYGDNNTFILSGAYGMSIIGGDVGSHNNTVDLSSVANLGLNVDLQNGVITDSSGSYLANTVTHIQNIIGTQQGNATYRLSDHYDGQLTLQGQDNIVISTKGNDANYQQHSEGAIGNFNFNNQISYDNQDAAITMTDLGTVTKTGGGIDTFEASTGSAPHVTFTNIIGSQYDDFFHLKSHYTGVDYNRTSGMTYQINGGKGNDIFSYEDGSYGNYNLAGGDGDDELILSGTYNSSEVTINGQHQGTFYSTGGYNASQFSSVEKIVFNTNSNYLNINVANANLSVDATHAGMSFVDIHAMVGNNIFDMPDYEVVSFDTHTNGLTGSVLSYSKMSDALTIDLNNDLVTDQRTGVSDVTHHVRRVQGGHGDDTITGYNNADNFVYAGAGNDSYNFNNTGHKNYYELDIGVDQYLGQGQYDDNTFNNGSTNCFQKLTVDLRAVAGRESITKDYAYGSDSTDTINGHLDVLNFNAGNYANGSLKTFDFYGSDTESSLLNYSNSNVSLDSHIYFGNAKLDLSIQSYNSGSYQQNMTVDFSRLNQQIDFHLDGKGGNSYSVDTGGVSDNISQNGQLQSEFDVIGTKHDDVFDFSSLASLEKRFGQNNNSFDAADGDDTLRLNRQIHVNKDLNVEDLFEDFHNFETFDIKNMIKDGGGNTWTFDLDNFIHQHRADSNNHYELDVDNFSDIAWLHGGSFTQVDRTHYQYNANGKTIDVYSQRNTVSEHSNDHHSAVDNTNHEAAMVG